MNETRLEEPLWLLLIDKWDYILYERNEIFPNYDLSGTILEIGCGRRGWFSLMVKSYFPSFVVTTDILADKVRKAKDIASLLNLKSDDYVVADATHFPFREKTFEKIIGNAVLHHILPSLEIVTREIYRVMENTGLVIFTGEIVASRFLGWLWKKICLEKTPDEGITTKGVWCKAFLNVGFTQATILREHRCGYRKSILRDLYYRLIKHLSDELVIRYGLTSATIIATKHLEEDCLSG